ncbi:MULTISPECIES: CBS domain-containing protein [Streptomyces]|uniref:CBS domain-containing protein n=1 Tax=Streptomyces TaxID=1883 RepID=UPI000CD5673B|nr:MULTISPECIES: CBS domain-containing protein [Streptomyces]
MSTRSNTTIDRADSPTLVGQVMSSPCVTVSTEAPFKALVATMHRERVSALPVIDERQRVVGIVSEADLLPTEMYRAGDQSMSEPLAGLDTGGRAGGAVARQLMSVPVVTARSTDTLRQAARLMALNRVKRLPVVDDAGAVRGVVSRADLLTVFLRPDEELEREVRAQVLRPLARAGAGLSVTVTDGVVTLRGSFADSALVPLTARLARSVEGVVDVVFEDAV